MFYCGSGVIIVCPLRPYKMLANMNKTSRSGNIILEYHKIHVDKTENYCYAVLFRISSMSCFYLTVANINNQGEHDSLNL